MSAQNADSVFPHFGTCDQCAEGEKPLRSASIDYPDAWICADCVGQFDRAVVAVTAHIRRVQDLCGTRLCQVEPVITSSTFGPVSDVDLDFLVRDVLDAFFKAEARNDGTGAS